MKHIDQELIHFVDKYRHMGFIQIIIEYILSKKIYI